VAEGTHVFYTGGTEIAQFGDGGGGEDVKDRGRWVGGIEGAGGEAGVKVGF
jgi:hypothetical protein